MDFITGRIQEHVIDYADQQLPPFFKEFVTYVNEYKYAWHTSGHMGRQGFLRSPAGTAFHKFFGEEMLRALTNSTYDGICYNVNDYGSVMVLV